MLAVGFTAQGQSLKEALYGGKLKNQPGTVIRKGEDLSTKIDTATRADSVQKIASAESAKANATVPPATVNKNTAANPVPVAAAQGTDSLAQQALAVPQAAPAVTEAAAAAPVKDNNALWKDYINSMLPSFNSEMLPNKKVKKGSYSVMVSYTIDTDGQTAVTDVFVAPENDFIKEQVKTRLMDSPKLSPVLNSAGVARKMNRRHSFVLTKE